MLSDKFNLHILYS